LIVSDSGTGMPPDLIEKIFQPFFTTKAIGQGTGLGLSTVATIVHEHNGFVEVESLLGHGTRFLIFFPVCDVESFRSETTAPQLVNGNGELIVVADDDHSVREMIKLTLEAHNYRVLVAEDGAEALTLYIQRCDEIALVNTDVMMPVMNGRALIHAIRKFRPDLPIISFSATERSNSLVGGLDDAAVMLLKKPAAPEQLLLAIARSLHSASSANAATEYGARANQTTGSHTMR
jgi:CheY-like chemotaxis protein